MKEERYIPSIIKDDVILPLFTKELREHLLTGLQKQKEEAKERMRNDGWGRTKFGAPNPEYYGDFTHRFWSDFYSYLDRDLRVRESFQMSNILSMRCSEVKDGKFEVLPLYSEQWDNNSFNFFQGFKFDIEKYGVDFYKMGQN